MQQVVKSTAAPVGQAWLAEQGEILDIVTQMAALINRYDSLPLVAIDPCSELPITSDMFPAIQTMVNFMQHELTTVKPPTLAVPHSMRLVQ